MNLNTNRESARARHACVSSGRIHLSLLFSSSKSEEHIPPLRAAQVYERTECCNAMHAACNHDGEFVIVVIPTTKAGGMREEEDRCIGALAFVLGGPRFVFYLFLTASECLPAPPPEEPRRIKRAAAA